MRHRALVLLVTVSAWSCGEEPTRPEAAPPAGLVVSEAPLGTAKSADGPADHAVVTFGRGALGTDFFPPGSHDGSFHAKDAIRPRTVVISAGGTVDFVIDRFHKPALYEPGIEPEDIDVTLLEDAGAPFEFPPVINDPDGRIARGALNLGDPVVWSRTFTEPGRYLVICEVLPHFVDGAMYAWVEVK